jgi:hypothetical protein
MTPKFYTTKRAGKIALWVSMSKNGDYNIWDVSEKNWNEEVQGAVISAFYRGVECHTMLVKRCCVDGKHNQRFDEEEK